MVLNEVLNKQFFLSKVLLEKEGKELPKELKVKIMRLRIKYNKYKNSFDEDVKVFVEQCTPQELKDLASKEDRTEEENNLLTELSNKLNAEYQEFVIQKGQDVVEENLQSKPLTMADYEEIVDVNSGVTIQELPGADFLEIIYNLFVEEDQE
jgi:hypothetical protein